ncbi:response regulator transcription factor [Acidimangrovimonas sediminis]|uniref:response regulator transcription factor n=1 Tax=Acidimangrovimonas sediminis TaxID=2056283 RepID=UPI000C7F918F|nr:response regulator [Acidimangrovimonas sediminis]
MNAPQTDPHASPAAQRRDRVLIVDDSPDALGMLTEALERGGMTALVATGGDAALALLDRITPDLVLMDAVMPGMDGFETTRRIKARVGAEHLPVIFMTGLSETEHVVAGLAAGGVDYVTKPIVIAELLARIRVHLDNGRRALGTRNALDAAGRNLMSLDAGGRILWSTPRTGALLAEVLGPGAGRDGFGTQQDLAGKLAGLREGGARREDPSLTLEIATAEGLRRLGFTYLSPIGPGEYLYRVSEDIPGAREALLRDTFALTEREAEVLLWLAAGKTNRDISDILGISPQTVKKHLEQVFSKLGAENRATATAMAVRALVEGA